MPLPPALATIMVAFQPLFDHRVYSRAVVLVAGALLAVRTRTVTAALRVTSHDDARFSAYHRVLSRARWSCLDAARILLGLVVDRFVPDGPVVVGLDDTIERRWGKRIAARGIYRDPVRSSRGHFVKASGLRWLSLSVLADIRWAGRVWALPFLAVLAPSARYYAKRGRPAKTLADQARQAVLQLARWLPDRQIVVVADTGFAAIDLLAAVRSRVAFVTRLRLDAALYDPAGPRRAGQRGRTPKKGPRQPTLAARAVDPATTWRAVVVSQWYGQPERTVEVATGTAVWYHVGKPVVPLRWVLVRIPGSADEPKGFLCTDLDAEPLAVVGWYVRRWTVEVTLSVGTSASRRSANGRASPSRGRRRACWVSSQSSRWRRTRSMSAASSQLVRARGTRNRPLPSATHSPPCEPRCGGRPFLRHRGLGRRRR